VRSRDLGVCGEELRIELSQEFFALLLDYFGVERGICVGLCHLGRRGGYYRRDALFAVADWADVEVAGIVEVTLGAGHSIAGRLASTHWAAMGGRWVHAASPGFRGWYGAGAFAGRGCGLIRCHIQDLV